MFLARGIPLRTWARGPEGTQHTPSHTVAADNEGEKRGWWLVCPAPEIFPCFQQQGRGKGHGDNHVQSQHKTYSLSLVIPRADGRADRPPRALLEMGRSGGRGSGGRLLLTQAGPGLHLLPAFRPHSASLHFAFHVQLVLCSWCKDENVNSFQSFFL